MLGRQMYSIALVPNQSSEPLGLDGMNRAAGSQQLRKRGRESSATTTKITPGLRSRPLNEGCMNQRRGLTDLHLYTVFLTDEKPPSPMEINRDITCGNSKPKRRGIQLNAATDWIARFDGPRRKKLPTLVLLPR